MWSVSENSQKCASFAWFQQNIVSLWSGVSFGWLISALHFLLSSCVFSSHVVYCEDRLLSFPTQYSLSVHDSCDRGPLISMLPICFVENKRIRKSLIGQIILYYLKRHPYVRHSFFSETQKLQFSVNSINFDLRKLYKTQISDVCVMNLLWLTKLFWTFINKGNIWYGMLGREKDSAVSDDWTADYTSG